MVELKPYPVSITGDLSDPPGRWVWLFKWLLIVPHVIILYFLYIAVFFVTVVAFFAILFTGKYPRGLFDFSVGVMRWGWRVSFYSYSVLGTDKYPPFSLERNGYPADFDAVYPDRLSRGLVLVKWWLLAIPHYIIISVFSEIIPILVLVCAVILLFTGKYQPDLFKFIMGLNRWMYRVFGYAMLLTDDYPPFSLD